MKTVIAFCTAVGVVMVLGVAMIIGWSVGRGVGFDSVTHGAGASSASASPTLAAAVQPTVRLSEWKVDAPAALNADIYKFTISNTGHTEHELLVFRSDLPVSQYPLESSGDISEDGAGITKISDGDNIAPGKSQTRAIDLSTPGRYLFVCNIPSHFKMGMFAVVTVSAGPGAPQAVILNEWKVTAPPSVKAGKYNFTIANAGQAEHELLVFKSDLGPAQYPLEGSGNIAEDGPGITKVSDGNNIVPGTAQTRIIELSTPGKYLFVCNIPGHFKMGMFAVVTVTP